MEKPSDSFISAVNDVSKEPIVEAPSTFVAEEMVHVHGYGVISRERAKEGLVHHQKMIQHYTEAGNETMARNHAGLAVHFHRAVHGPEHK